MNKPFDYPWSENLSMIEIRMRFEQMSDKRMFYNYDGCSFSFARYLMDRIDRLEKDKVAPQSIVS